RILIAGWTGSETERERIEERAMRAEPTSKQFSEQLVQQVRLDARRALAAGLYCVDRSVVEQVECVEFRDETDQAFGTQLWYFDGTGVDQHNCSVPLYGVIEYSLEYGLNEPVQDAVFDSSAQRERFHAVYRRESWRPSWRDPPHRWLLVGLAIVSVLTLGAFYFLSINPFL
ncbi:MAG: hypothetical protein WD119_00870, partial [Pirellulaceae bacterium]